MNVRVYINDRFLKTVLVSDDMRSLTIQAHTLDAVRFCKGPKYHTNTECKEFRVLIEEFVDGSSRRSLMARLNSNEVEAVDGKVVLKVQGISYKDLVKLRCKTLEILNARYNSEVNHEI